MEESDRKKLQKLREMALAIHERPEDEDVEFEELMNVVNKILELADNEIYYSDQADVPR